MRGCRALAGRAAGACAEGGGRAGRPPFVGVVPWLWWRAGAWRRVEGVAGGFLAGWRAWPGWRGLGVSGPGGGWSGDAGGVVYGGVVVVAVGQECGHVGGVVADRAGAGDEHGVVVAGADGGG